MRKELPINSATSSEITINLLKRIEPGESEYYVSDTTVSGFVIRVRPTGGMSYYYIYRFGSGRSAPTRKCSIGSIKKVTPDEARKVARKYAAEVVNGGDPANDKSVDKAAPTFDMLKNSYLDSVDAKHKSATYGLYSHWLGLASPALGRKKAKDVDAGDIEKLHVGMKGKTTTANRVLSTISSMYSWGISTKQIPKMDNPCGGIKKYAEDSRERYLTREELSRLGDAVREAETGGIPWDPAPEKKVKHAPKAENRRITIDKFSAAAIRLFILTGARRGEILKLKWSNVDLERGLIFLDDSKTRKKTIILNSPAQFILSELPKMGIYVIPGEPKTLPDGSIHERPRSDLKRPWHHIRRRAGLDASVDNSNVRVRIHDLRHTHASVGVESNLSLQIIGKLLGHTQAKTTERYAHLADDPKRRASDLIGSKIVKAMGDKPRR
ncbi:site-specific integrase [Neorhizobium galegae]|uniref:Site-specific integrase n=1 Tax=Neorhizobium galegae TaxID=399 RepID=A0A6A1TWK8_NEOGA|nr:site-specific integrase [Neorhizobium galegae]KAB1089003.1 site-specific integrase [Neorhizobium galegae]